MFNNEVFESIGNKYPSRIKDIGESISLLNLVVDDLLQDINIDITKSLSEKDHEKASKYLELHKQVCDLYNDNSNLIDIIENFDYEDKEDDVEQIETEEKWSMPDYSKYVVDQNIPHTLYEDFEFMRPIAFNLKGISVEASNWANVLQLTCEELYKLDSEVFNNFIQDKNMNGKKKSYFSYTQDNIRKPRKLSCVDIYIETNLSANSIKQIIIKMLKKYQIKLTDFIVYFRADYTELNKEEKK